MREALWIFAAILSTGCLYIPNMGVQFDEAARGSIVVSETTSQEIIELLDEPNILDTSHLDVYQLSDAKGMFLLVFGGGYSGGVLPVDVGNGRYNVLLGLDEKGVVDRLEIEAGNQNSFGNNYAIVPLNPGIAPELAGRELLFEQSISFMGRPTIERKTFYAPAFSMDGSQVGVAGGNGDMQGYKENRIWVHDLPTGVTRSFEVSKYDNIAWAEDFRHLVAHSRKGASAVDIENEIIVSEFDWPDYSFWFSGGIHSVSVARYGKRVAAGGAKGFVRIWELQNAQESISFQASERDGPIESLAWSNDGRLIATSEQAIKRDDGQWSYGSVRVWQAEDGVPLATIDRQTVQVSSYRGLAFSPSNKLLAINEGSHVEVWRLDNNQVSDIGRLTASLLDVFLLPYIEDGDIVSRGLAFSPDGKLLAASNGALVMYSLESSQILLRFTPTLKGNEHIISGDAVLGLAFSPDGKQLATGSFEGVHIWPVGKMK